jgi:hypothetical protein
VVKDMEIIKKYKEFYREVVKIGLNCIAEGNEIFFSVPMVDVTEKNREKIYLYCISKLENFYNIKIDNIGLFNEKGITFVKIIEKN